MRLVRLSHTGTYTVRRERAEAKGLSRGVESTDARLWGVDVKKTPRGMGPSLHVFIFSSRPGPARPSARSAPHVISGPAHSSPLYSSPCRHLTAGTCLLTPVVVLIYLQKAPFTHSFLSPLSKEALNPKP